MVAVTSLRVDSFCVANAMLAAADEQSLASRYFAGDKTSDNSPCLGGASYPEFLS